MERISPRRRLCLSPAPPLRLACSRRTSPVSAFIGTRLYLLSESVEKEKFR